MPGIHHMPIDIGFIAFFAYGFWQGYSRGIIGTVFNVLMYIFGFVLAFKMAPTTTSILQTMFHSENPSMFLFAFMTNLVILMLLFKYAAAGLEGVLRMAYLGVINQAMGGMAMGGFMVLIYSVLVWFAVKVQFVNEATIAESRTYTLLEPLPGRAKNFAIRMKPFALDVWGTSMNWMDRLEQYGVQKTEVKDNKNYRPPDDFKAIEEDPASSPRTQPAAKPRPILEDSDGIEE